MPPDMSGFDPTTGEVAPDAGRQRRFTTGGRFGTPAEPPAPPTPAVTAAPQPMDARALPLVPGEPGNPVEADRGPDDDAESMLGNRYDEVERQRSLDWLAAGHDASNEDLAPDRASNLGGALGRMVGRASQGVPLDQADAQFSRDIAAGAAELPVSRIEYVGDVWRKARAAAGDVVRGVIEAPTQVVGGARDAVQAMLDGVDWLADNLERVVPAGRVTIDVNDKGQLVPGWQPHSEATLAGNQLATLPEVDAAKSVTGGLIRSASQFVTSMAAAGKLLGAVGIAAKGATGAARYAQITGQGGIASFIGFKGNAGRLTDTLLHQVPQLRGTVLDYLATDPTDGEAEARLKNAVEGLGLGLVADGLFAALRTARAARALPDRPQAIPDAITGEAAPRRDMLLLGSPDAPLVARPGDQAATKLLAAVDETSTGGVPVDVTARSLTEKGLTPLGTGEVYVNFGRISTGEDIQRVIQDAATAMKPQIDEAARGVQSHAATQVAAGQIDDAFGMLMQRRTGQPLNAEQSVAARQLWTSAADHLQTVARIAAADPSVENLVQFRRMLATFHAIQKEVIGARTETARALNAWAIPVGNDKQTLARLEELVSFSGGVDVNRDLALKVAGLNSREALSALADTSVYARTRDAVQELFINAVLSGPKTHVANMVSNASVAGLQIFETAAASRLGKIFGGDDVVQVGEALAQAHGMMAGLGDALRNAARTLRTGEIGFGINKIETGLRTRAISSTAWNLRSDSIAGRAVDALGAIVTSPGRALQAEDEFFKTIGYRMSLHQQAYRQAAREVSEGRLTLADVPQRMADIVAAPTPGMSMEAAAQAAYQTFTDDPGKFIRKLNGLRSEYPMLRFIVPFINTPANVFRFTAERTPLAPAVARFRAAIAQGGRAADLAKTRVALGTMLMLFATDMGLNGHFTGGGPSNPAEAANLRRQGWQPYSVKLGGKYFSFNRLAPLGLLMGFGADLGEYLANADSMDEMDSAAIEDAMKAGVFSIINNVMSQSFLMGFTDTVEAINDPVQYGEGWINRMAGSIAVPAGVREVTRFVDPVQRYATGVLEEIKSRLPGFSATLPPRRDFWGREVRYQSGMGPVYDALSPVYGSTENREPIDRLMQEDGWFLGMPAKALVIGGRRVSFRNRMDIYSRLLELRGQTRPSELGPAGEKLTALYGDGTLLETLNGLVTTPPPPPEPAAPPPAGLIAPGNISIQDRPVVHGFAPVQPREQPADAPGMIEPATISLQDRPAVRERPNGPDVSIRPIVYREGDDFVVLPTVSEAGTIVSEARAIATYRRNGQHLGKFDNESSAEAYSLRLEESPPPAPQVEGDFSIRPIVFDDGGRFIVLPTVTEAGTIVSNNAAIGIYRRTGSSLGVFDSRANAAAFARSLNEIPPSDRGGMPARTAEFARLANASERELYIRKIVADYQDAAKSVIFGEFPELLQAPRGYDEEE